MAKKSKKSRGKSKSLFLPIVISGILSYSISFYIAFNTVESKIMNVSSNIIEAIKDTEENGTLLSLPLVTKRLSWDKVYILTPYTDVKQLFKEEGIKYNKFINFDINHSDDIYTLAFIDSINKSGKLVGYADIPLSLLETDIKSPTYLDKDKVLVLLNNNSDSKMRIMVITQ